MLTGCCGVLSSHLCNHLRIGIEYKISCSWHQILELQVYVLDPLLGTVTFAYKLAKYMIKEGLCDLRQWLAASQAADDQKVQK